MNENFEKSSKNSRDQFLCYKKLEINVFRYQALKEHIGSYIELPKSLQRQGLISIKIQIIIVLFGHIFVI